MTTRTALWLVVLVVIGWVPQSHAAEQWIEVSSPHFTIVSNAGDRAARSLRGR
jgi:hypothetical protein